MQYYKNTDGHVYGFDTHAEREQFGSSELVAMSPDEIEAHLNPPSDPAPPKQFTSLEYLDLFTEAEQLAVVTATMAVPQVKLWYDKMLAAGFITTADPRTEGGLAALVGAGLLTETRKVEILAVMA